MGIINRKYSILIIMIIFNSCSSHFKLKGINNYRTGEFIYKEKEFRSTYIIRDSIYQFEIDSINNVENKLKINWLNNYEYTLSFVSSTDSLQNSISIGQRIHVTIIKSRKKYYKCVAEMNNDKLTLTMIKVK